jgi:anti-sigma factor RsiW
MSREAAGAVVALCLQQSNSTTTTPPTFNEQTIKGFDFVSWRAGDAQYVVIGDSDRAELPDIAAAAALEI